MRFVVRPPVQQRIPAPHAREPDDPIVGDSDVLRNVMLRVDQVASTDATVLLSARPAPARNCWPTPFTGAAREPSDRSSW